MPYAREGATGINDEMKYFQRLVLGTEKRKTTMRIPHLQSEILTSRI
jgi:hypothetical protein